MAQRLTENDVTPQSIYLRRREFMALGVTALGALTLPRFANASPAPWLNEQINRGFATTVTTDEALTPFADASTYNNYFEFGTGKSDPVRNSGNFKSDPWSVEVSGHCRNPGSYDLADWVTKQTLQERIYRLRCVEAWSMVIPWLGFPLHDLIKQLEPTSEAKYIRFETLYDPAQFPNQRSWFSAIDYPYVEGLRLDEAMHPLAFMAVGMYGQTLPNQNGAPWRLVVPWKYGFKSLKAIAKIEFTSTQPSNTWAIMQPREYGFYANVNPAVNHPRWSQATERRLPANGLTANIIPTQMFNGYADEVAHLYAGLDLSLQRYF